jgi:hypothetical protein
MMKIKAIAKTAANPKKTENIYDSSKQEETKLNGLLMGLILEDFDNPAYEKLLKEYTSRLRALKKKHTEGKPL